MHERLIRIHNPTKGNSSTGKSIPCFTDSLSYPNTISAAMVLWDKGACTHLTNTWCFSYILIFPLIMSLAFANFYPAVPLSAHPFLSLLHKVLSFIFCLCFLSLLIFFVPIWYSDLLLWKAGCRGDFIISALKQTYWDLKRTIRHWRSDVRTHCQQPWNSKR